MDYPKQTHVDLFECMMAQDGNLASYQDDHIVMSELPLATGTTS